MKDMYVSMSRAQGWSRLTQRLTSLWKDAQPPDYDAQAQRWDADSELPETETETETPEYPEEDEVSTSRIVRFDETQNIVTAGCDQIRIQRRTPRHPGSTHVVSRCPLRIGLSSRGSRSPRSRTSLLSGCRSAPAICRQARPAGSI